MILKGIRFLENTEVYIGRIRDEFPTRSEDLGEKDYFTIICAKNLISLSCMER